MVDKTCTRCLKPKPVDDFRLAPACRDGRYPRCRDCEAEQSRNYRAANIEAVRAVEKAKADRNRDKVFAHYGTSCACCGSEKDLTIDHVEGGGASHREEVLGYRSWGQSTKFYRWLIRNGFPEGFQVLCGPCNSSKGAGTSCRIPHDRPVVLTTLRGSVVSCAGGLVRKVNGSKGTVRAA